MVIKDQSMRISARKNNAPPTTEPALNKVRFVKSPITARIHATPFKARRTPPVFKRRSPPCRRAIPKIIDGIPRRAYARPLKKLTAEPGNC
jgi:hypothetical protein